MVFFVKASHLSAAAHLKAGGIPGVAAEAFRSPESPAFLGYQVSRVAGGDGRSCHSSPRNDIPAAAAIRILSI